MATGEAVERPGNPALLVLRGTWGWIDSRLGLSMDYHVFLLSRIRERFEQIKMDLAGS